MATHHGRFLGRPSASGGDVRPAPFSELLSRRGALTAGLTAFAGYALLAESRAAAASLDRRISARRWIHRQDEIARELSAGRIRPVRWAQEVEALGREVDFAQLMAEAHRSEVAKLPERYGNDPQKRFVRFVDDTGQPRELTYGAAFFAFDPHNVITPHCHQHMVSAHMVVEGRLRVRNYDRLRDEAAGVVIRPTRDYVARLGQVSTMCSERDNVHWFTPQGGSAATFDVVVSGLIAGGPDHVIQALDPVGGARRSDGTIVAPVMSFDDSSRKYTTAV